MRRINVKRIRRSPCGSRIAEDERIATNSPPRSPRHDREFCTWMTTFALDPAQHGRRLSTRTGGLRRETPHGRRIPRGRSHPSRTMRRPSTTWRPSCARSPASTWIIPNTANGGSWVRSRSCLRALRRQAMAARRRPGTIADLATSPGFRRAVARTSRCTTSKSDTLTSCRPAQAADEASDRHPAEPFRLAALAQAIGSVMAPEKTALTRQTNPRFSCTVLIVSSSDSNAALRLMCAQFGYVLLRLVFILDERARDFQQYAGRNYWPCSGCDQTADTSYP